MTKVAEIASIRNGYAFRGRIESDKDGDTRVIQASDLTQDTELDKGELACVQLGKKASRYQLRENDIVFMARGHRQNAYRPVRKAVAGKPVITAFGLLVITANEQHVIPEYLHWVLNTQRVQQRIQALKEGTSITFISDKKFGDVVIPLPPILTQKKISHLIALHTQRTQVRQQLADMDEKIAQATAWSLATEQKQ